MKLFRDFLKDRSGATAVTFGLMLVPILGVTGLAVDYGVATNERGRLQDAADAAALAGASVFTGANQQAAENRARAYLKANLGAKYDAVTVDFSAANQRVTVSLGSQTKTMFMHILDQDTMAVGVNAQALAPLKPSSAEINIGDMYGYWAKKISIIVVRPGQTTEQVVGTVTYEAQSKTGGNGRGTGLTTKDPATSNIVLGEYSKLYIKMEVKKDGCNYGRYNSTPSSNTVFTCKDLKDSKYKKYDLTLRTDDPATVNHLFVDGVQLKLGSTPPLEDLLNCDEEWHDHAWEDGGGFAQQDFFYQIKSACKSVDGENVRLTH